SRISAYPRAAPKRPRAWTLRAPSRKAARSSASAVGLPLGRGAKYEAADGVDSKAHDRLRAKARDGAQGLRGLALQLNRQARPARQGFTCSSCRIRSGVEAGEVSPAR